jgi:hypothetical protein
MKFYRLPDYNVHEGWSFEGDATRPFQCMDKKEGKVRSVKFVHDGSWECRFFE